MDLERNRVNSAVEALLKCEEQKKQNKTELLDEDVAVQLHFGFKKVPNVTNKVIKVRLPHTVITDTTSICLFVKDLKGKKSNADDAEEAKTHFEDLLEKHNIQNIGEVIPLKTLKTDYIPYEAKRNLSNMFDVFLTDDRIAHRLPNFLGKHFYSRKKYPVQVKLEVKNLKNEFSRVLSISQCVVTGRGSSCQIKVGHGEMSAESLVENIIVAVKKVTDSLPAGMSNLKTVHIKTIRTPALTVYFSSESPNEINFPTEKPVPLDPPEDVTTVMNGQVQVFPDGRVKIIGKGQKGQSHLKGEVKTKYAGKKGTVRMNKNLAKKKSLKKVVAKKNKAAVMVKEVKAGKILLDKEEQVVVRKQKRKAVEDIAEEDISSPRQKKVKAVNESLSGKSKQKITGLENENTAKNKVSKDSIEVKIKKGKNKDSSSVKSPKGEKFEDKRTPKKDKSKKENILSPSPKKMKKIKC